MGSSFVTHSSGSFSGLSAAGGTSGGTSSAFIKGRFVSAPAAGLAENSQSALRAMSRDARNYTAIQLLVLRQDAICRELFERAIATAFTQFARQIRRFDQRIQASSSRGYIAERIQRTRISYDFGNAADLEGDYRFSVEHRLKNA